MNAMKDSLSLSDDIKSLNSTLNNVPDLDVTAQTVRDLRDFTETDFQLAPMVWTYIENLKLFS